MTGSFDKNRLFYSKSGNGPAMIFLHGYMLTSKIWGLFSDELSKNYTCLLIDLAGDGNSYETTWNQDFSFLTSLVKQIIDRENIQKLTIIGHSLGGYIAMEFASQYPEMTEALVLLHVNSFYDSAEKKKRRLREIKLIKAGKKNILIRTQLENSFADTNRQKFNSTIQQMEKAAYTIKPESLIGYLNAMMNRKDRYDTLNEKAIPVLLFFGAKDSNFSKINLRSMEKSIRTSKSKILQNSAHMGFLEEMDSVLRDIKKFV